MTYLNHFNSDPARKHTDFINGFQKKKEEKM